MLHTPRFRKALSVGFWITFLLVNVTHAQNASIQDCLGAIPVCQQVYEEDKAPTGFGQHLEIDGAINCIPFESNSIWYVFTVNNTGQFGFLLTPNNPVDDYDWALFNISDATCEDILTDGSLLVSCNAAGGGECIGLTGATGDTEYEIQGADCGTEPPTQGAGFSAFNDFVDVVEGETYLLFINNFSGSQDGYTLDFGLSADIGIFDETEPVLESVAFSDVCDGKELQVQFSEYIQCSTITASNFIVSGPNGPYTTTLSSSNCAAEGNFAKEFTLMIDPPISGDFTLELSVDGSTEVLDLCDNPAAPIEFTLTGPGPGQSLNLGNDTTLCEGSTLILDVSQIAGDYLWNDGSTGSTLSVQTAGFYSVEVSTDCGTASDEIEVRFTNAVPDIDLGGDISLCPTETVVLDATSPDVSYRWSNGSTGATIEVDTTGTYAVTISNGCGMAEDSITVNLAAAITATLEDISLCEGEDFTWDVVTPGATYQWQDSSTDPTYTVSMPGNYSVEITTGCEMVMLMAEVTVGGTLPAINLGNDTTLCAGEMLTFDFNIPDASFLWQDGSTAASYTIDQKGNYTVVVSNACDTISDDLLVTVPAPIVLAMPRDTNLCGGATLLLDAGSEQADYYLWQDGSTEPSFLVDVPGTYSVMLGNDCEELSADINVNSCVQCDVFFPNAFSPNNDGINDELKAFTSCIMTDFELMIFDRWGTLLFQTNDQDRGWDGFSRGKAVSPGVYIWSLKVKVQENEQLRELSLAGDVMVLK